MSPPTSEKPTPEQTSARDENHCLLERYGLPTLSAKEELESKVMTKKISASVVGAAHVASMINYTRVPLFALMEELWQRGHEAAAEMELETKIADGESIA